MQNYKKILNQNTKKIPGIEFALYNCTGEMAINKFAYLNGLFSLFYFYFLMNLTKEYFYGARTLTAEPSSFHLMRANIVLAGPPLPPSSGLTL